MHIKTSQIPDILKRTGVLSSSDLQHIFQEQQQWGGRLSPLLVEMGLLREDFLVKILSRELRIPIATLDGMRRIDPEALRRLPVALCERFDVMPVGIDRNRGLLQVAMSDPTEQEALKEISGVSGMKLQLFVAGVTAIRRAVRIYFYGESTAEVLRVVPDAFPDPNQASAYASGQRPSAVSLNEVPQADIEAISFPSDPALPAAPSSTPSVRKSILRPGTGHIGPNEDDWVSGTSFLEEEVSGSVGPAPRADADPHSYTGLPANLSTAPHAAPHTQELQHLQARLQELKEKHQQELKDFQKITRQRLQEQRALIRGLIDLMVSRGLLSREDLTSLLSQVSRASKQP